MDSKYGGGNNARPWVIIVDHLEIECADDISDILMNIFYDSIGLWVPSCDRTALKSTVFALNLVKLCY